MKEIGLEQFELMYRILVHFNHDPFKAEIKNFLREYIFQGMG